MNNRAFRAGSISRASITLARPMSAVSYTHSGWLRGYAQTRSGPGQDDGRTRRAGHDARVARRRPCDELVRRWLAKSRAASDNDRDQDGFEHPGWQANPPEPSLIRRDLLGKPCVAGSIRGDSRSVSAIGERMSQRGVRSPPRAPAASPRSRPCCPWRWRAVGVTPRRASAPGSGAHPRTSEAADHRDHASFSPLSLACSRHRERPA